MSGIVGELVSRKEISPYVSFSTRAIENKPKSLEAGHYVGVDVDYVEITPAYTKDIVIKTVDAWFKQLDVQAQNGQIPPEWPEKYRQQYRAWQNKQEIPLEGMPIKEWGVISPSQREALLSMNIRTVEDLAAVNEDGLRRIGMGAVELKNKARAALAAAKDTGSVVMENANLRQKLSVAEVTLQTQSGQIAALFAELEGLKGQTPAPYIPQFIPPSPSISAAEILDTKPSHDELVAAYEEKFGKAPHHRMKDETIAEAIRGA